MTKTMTSFAGLMAASLLIAAAPSDIALEDNKGGQAAEKAQGPKDGRGKPDGNRGKSDDDRRYGGTPVTAELLGENEVGTEGDPDASGFIDLRLNQGQESACYTLETSGLEDVLFGHIHLGSIDENGPVLVTLFNIDEGEDLPELLEACVDVDAELVGMLRASPEDYYVNVHSAEYPAGALRGQLEPPGNGADEEDGDDNDG